MADLELQRRLKPLRRSPAVDPEAGRGAGSPAAAAPSPSAKNNATTKKKTKKKATPSFLAVLSLCDPFDALLLVIGCIGAAANGAALPLFSLAFGAMVDVLGPAANAGALRKEVERVASYFLILAAGKRFERSCWWRIERRKEGRRRAAAGADFFIVAGRARVP